MTVRLLGSLLAVAVLCSSLPWEVSATPCCAEASAADCADEASAPPSAPVPVDCPCSDKPTCLCHAGGGFVPPEVHSDLEAPQGTRALTERTRETHPGGVIGRIFRPPRVR